MTLIKCSIIGILIIFLIFKILVGCNLHWFSSLFHQIVVDYFYLFILDDSEIYFVRKIFFLFWVLHFHIVNFTLNLFCQWCIWTIKLNLKLKYLFQIVPYTPSEVLVPIFIFFRFKFSINIAFLFFTFHFPKVNLLKSWSIMNLMGIIYKFNHILDHF